VKTTGNERPWPINDSYFGAMFRCLCSEPAKDYDLDGNPRLSVMTPDGKRHYVVDVKYDGFGGVILHTKPMLED